MPREPGRGEPSRAAALLRGASLRLSPRAASPAPARETRKGPAFWSDASPRVRREPLVLAPPREAPAAGPAPTGFLGVVSWWPISALTLVTASVVLFLVLISFIATFIRKVDDMSATFSRLQRWESKLKWAVRHEAGGRSLTCKPCQANWQQWGDACYLRTAEAATWTRCVALCQEAQATLLIGYTEGEMVLLLQSLHWLSGQGGWHAPEHYWVGLRYNFTQRVWHWVDGENLHLRLPVLRNKPPLPMEACIFVAGGQVGIEDCREENRCLCKAALA